MTTRLPLPLWYTLAGIGTITLAFRVLSVSRLIYRLYIRRSTLPRYISPDASGHSSWALITGASDGIGLALAHELCAHGANVVLHGRNPAKLAHVRAELLATHPERKIETVVADAGQENARGAIEEIMRTVTSLPDGGRLRILINNVGGSNAWAGVSGPIYHRFDELGFANVDALINVNVRFGTLLTAAVLPIFTADNTPSLIINLSSMAGINPLPYMVVYSASKAYNLLFSASLAAEVKTEGRNIEVLGLVVGNVDTPGAPAKDKAGLSVKPQTFAREVVQAVGCGERMVPPGWRDWVTRAMIGITPRAAMDNAMKALFEAMQKKQKAT